MTRRHFWILLTCNRLTLPGSLTLSVTVTVAGASLAAAYQPASERLAEPEHHGHHDHDWPVRLLQLEGVTDKAPTGIRDCESLSWKNENPSASEWLALPRYHVTELSPAPGRQVTPPAPQIHS